MFLWGDYWQLWNAKEVTLGGFQHQVALLRLGGVALPGIQTCFVMSLHSTLYTPHFTLYTPHFTHQNLHSILYTPRTILYSLHPNFSLHTLPATLSHISQSTVQWYGNRGKLYKHVQICCFTKVLYMIAFGFEGYIMVCTLGQSKEWVLGLNPLELVDGRCVRRVGSWHMQPNNRWNDRKVCL